MTTGWSTAPPGRPWPPSKPAKARGRRNSDVLPRCRNDWVRCRECRDVSWRETLERPALAVLVVEVLVGLRNVGHAERGAVPRELAAAQTHADRAQQDGLGERAGEVEGRTGGRASLAGIDPFLVVADRAGERLGRT